MTTATANEASRRLFSAGDMAGQASGTRKPPRPHWTTFARGKRKKPGEMNKTERTYAAHLDQLKALGEIAWFAYEGMSFRLGKNASYRPDFVVMLPDGEIQCIEVKGFWAEAARVRIKVAADKFPFRFVAVTPRSKKNGGGWKEEEF